MKKSNVNYSFKLANQANNFSKSGQYKKAIELLQRAIKMNSNEAGFYSNLGNIYSRQKQYIKSIKEYQEALTIEPENHLFCRNIGLSFFHLKEYQQAINYFELSLKANPDDTSVMHDIGLSYYYLKSYKKSLFWFDKVVELSPNNFNALKDKGLVLSKMNMYTDALKFYKIALRINPTDSATLSDMGVIFLKIGNWSKAMEKYNKAIEIDPKNPKIFLNKGIALKSKKKYNEALKCFDKAIELNPKYDEAYIHKGLLLKLIKFGKIKNYVLKNIDSCYIAFFDILGFGDLVKNNSHEYLKKLYFNDFDFSISASLSDVKASINGPIERAINSMTISDSIIFWTNNDSLESFYVLFTAASTLMITSLSMGLPLRGAITNGELSMSHGFYDYNQSSIKSSLIGKPLVNAYELEKQQKWSGCIIDDKCIKLYKKSIIRRKLVEKDPYGISNLINSDLIVEYDVPLKCNSFKKKYVINWTKGGLFEHYSISELESAFSEHKKNIERDDVKIKIKNTLEFYKKMKNE
jgi:tetratricopeptide (TPR) repeat protein